MGSTKLSFCFSHYRVLIAAGRDRQPRTVPTQPAANAAATAPAREVRHAVGLLPAMRLGLKHGRPTESSFEPVPANPASHT